MRSDHPITLFRRSSRLGISLVAALLAGFVVAGCLSPDDPLDPATLSELEEVDCDTVTETYDNFARNFFNRYCLSCHSENLVGDIARTDAPIGIDFDTLEGVESFALRIRLRTGELGDMPPRILSGPQPSHEERIRLIKWLDCGLNE